MLYATLLAQQQERIGHILCAFRRFAAHALSQAGNSRPAYLFVQPLAAPIQDGPVLCW